MESVSHPTDISRGEMMIAFTLSPSTLSSSNTTTTSTTIDETIDSILSTRHLPSWTTIQIPFSSFPMMVRGLVSRYDEMDQR
jgi:hypothetical protein